MNKSIKVVSVFCVILLAQASFACEYPTRVKLPNGSTAAKEEMITAQKKVKAFVASMEIYIDCIVEEEKLTLLAMEELSSDMEEQREKRLNQKYNAAVDEMEIVAANFNSEVRAYKKRDD